MAEVTEIRKAIYDLLKTLTTANGYTYTYTIDESTDWEDVTEYGYETSPIVKLNDSAQQERNDDLSLCNSTAYECAWEIWVHSSVTGSDVERTERSNIEKDINRLVNNNPSLLGKATIFDFAEGMNLANGTETFPHKYIFSVRIVFERSW